LRGCRWSACLPDGVQFLADAVSRITERSPNRLSGPKLLVAESEVGCGPQNLPDSTCTKPTMWQLADEIRSPPKALKCKGLSLSKVGRSRTAYNLCAIAVAKYRFGTGSAQWSVLGRAIDEDISTEFARDRGSFLNGKSTQLVQHQVNFTGQRRLPRCSPHLMGHSGSRLLDLCKTCVDPSSRQRAAFQ